MLGPGDGGPASPALLGAARVNAGPTGAVLTSEPNGIPHERPLVLNGRREAGRIITDVVDHDRAAGAVRWIGASRPDQLQAAIAPTVYRSLARGQIPLVTTAGGAVKIVVRT